MSNRNNVYDEPLCPTCGELLELVECDELELDCYFFDYVKPCYGVCPKCGKSFRWLEVLEYKGVTNIEVTRHDEDEPDAYNRNPDMMALNP